MAFTVRCVVRDLDFVMETGLRFFEAIDHAEIYKKHNKDAIFTVIDESNNYDIVYSTSDEEV